MDAYAGGMFEVKVEKTRRMGKHQLFFRRGSFFSTLGAFPAGTGGGAAPIVNREPPAGACAGGAALNGEDG